jgi:hypothetical protein
VAARKAPTGLREARPDDRLRAVFASEVPASRLGRQGRANLIGIAGTSPAMTGYFMQAASAQHSPDARQALVFLTHIESIRILGHYERLKRETAGLLDTFLCVHEAAPRGAAPRILPADIRVSEPVGAQYAPKRHAQMRLRGSPYTFIDLIFMPVMSSERLEDYSHVWYIEYDVDYAGDWSHFFADFMRSEADFLATTIVARSDSPSWHWWKGFHAPPGVAPSNQARCFAPIARFSRRMITHYRQSVAAGEWRGHFEALFPSIALHAGFAVEDLGPGTRYTNTPHELTLSPGTFVFRPTVATQYFHENPRGFVRSNLLYHPVKPALM